MRTKSDTNEERRAIAREQFFTAIRALAASADSLQARVADATRLILQVKIDDFENNSELKIKFARLLDLLAIDQQDLAIIAEENLSQMSDLQAIKVADLMCDFYSDLG